MSLDTSGSGSGAQYLAYGRQLSPKGTSPFHPRVSGHGTQATPFSIFIFGAAIVVESQQQPVPRLALIFVIPTPLQYINPSQ
jgi:hypothetical protein